MLDPFDHIRHSRTRSESSHGDVPSFFFLARPNNIVEHIAPDNSSNSSGSVDMAHVGDALPTAIPNGEADNVKDLKEDDAAITMRGLLVTVRNHGEKISEAWEKFTMKKCHFRTPLL